MNALWERLTSQLQNKNNINYENAKSMAKGILMKRGYMDNNDNLTYTGMLRNMMSPEDRAIDRSIKRHGGNRNNYAYDFDKNYAYKKK